jgi:RNA polymerase sigma-70 factor (ECF subfamily)
MTNERYGTGGSPRLTLVPPSAPEKGKAPSRELDWSIMMARAQDGDREAYRRLLAALAPFLRARAIRRLGAPDEVEDVVQDILLTVHTMRQSYDPARPFGPWLVAIADRRMVDRLRRRGRRRKRDAALSTSYEIPREGPSTQDKTVLDSRALETAIAALPAEQSRAIRLLKLEERSLEEAAAETGLSIAALKVSTHRAIKRLRSLLVNWNDR